MAFQQNATPTFTKQPQASRVTIAVADTTTAKTVLTAGPNGSKLIGLFASTTDTSLSNIQVSITNGGTQYNMWVVPIPLTSGTAAASPSSVNLLNATDAVGLPVDNDGNPFLYLVSGDTLTVNALATLAAGIVTVHAIYADF
jgi:hypothetical protein